MTISVWRYSHLALALSSFLFITLASVSGIILAFEPISKKIPSYRVDDFNRISLAAAIPALTKSFSEVTDISVEANQFVTVKGVDTAGNNISAYVDARTGSVLGTPAEKSAFFEWVTAFHRSLFLHEAGRFLVGLAAFLLLLIALSGTILVVQRMRGWKRFFSRVVKENFAQYYHVVLGRLSLVVILVIAFSGAYLSLQRFGVFPEEKVMHNIDFDAAKSGGTKKPADFAVFKEILLSDVQTMEFPFSDDPEDYYTLKLKDREIVVDQFTGERMSEVRYPLTAVLSQLSLDLHTGRTSIVWAIVLGLACINILFFIYSGFLITWRRTKNRVKNKFKPEKSRFIILVGSENGSTIHFANSVHQQLIGCGQSSFLTQLDNYTVFPKAEHIVVITATYGLGDAPSNAKKFALLLEKFPQTQQVHFSVVGFGSHAYADFCRFGFEVNNLLSQQSWALPLVEIHTVNDKSPEQFGQWFETWAQKVELPQIILPEIVNPKQNGLQDLSVIEKTPVTEEDGAFIIRLKAGWRTKFHSGDLLAIYPANDHRERFYSIGKVQKDIQLSVRLYSDGLGSRYLYNLAPAEVIRAKIISNTHLRFPQNAAEVVMICNGTGIAPFLGMIDGNNKKVNCRLYCGFRGRDSFELYREALDNNMKLQKLRHLQVAYSREGEKQYVKDLLARDADTVARVLTHHGVVMLCGSLSMQNDVIELLEGVCLEKTGKNISFYQSRGQVLMDCY